MLTSSPRIGSAYEVNVTFTLSRLNDPQFSLTKYEWIIKGWSKCSKECGGGKQHLIMSCVDKLSGRRIRKKLCGPKSSRPSGKTRRCNTFSCNFEWASDRWEPCTHTCGSQGLRIRQTHCLPTNVSNLSGNLSTSGEVVQMWTKLVDPRKCPGDRPERIQECNRFPCPAKWESTGWSDCSETCGQGGVQKMIYECVPPEDCGLEPISVRKCQNQSPDCPQNVVRNSTTCPGGDLSPICGDTTMLRYCVIPGYREKCCQTCSDFNAG